MEKYRKEDRELRQQTKAPVRILHVLGRLDRGGAEAMVMNLYRAVDREKLQFDFVLHTEEECAYSAEVRKLGGRIFTVPAFSAQTASRYQKAWRELLWTHPEWHILHSHVRSTASLYLPIARKYGMKTIIHSHNTDSGKGLGAMVKSLLQYPLRFQADYLFACSQAAGEWLYGKKACRGKRFYLLKNAIDTGRFAFSEDSRTKKRRELGIPEQALVVGHIGRFEEQKNHRFLMKIWEAVNAGFAEWEIKQESLGVSEVQGKLEGPARECVLLCIGEGVLEPEIRKLAAEKGFTNVRFLGSRSDVNELLSAMDVFLFPSLFEGLPVTLIEAQAAGLPIVASDTITGEVMVTPLVQMCSLQESAKAWAGKIFQAVGERKKELQMSGEMSGQEIAVSAEDWIQERKYGSQSAIRRIQAAGYDITQTAAWLSDFYLFLEADAAVRV